MNTSAASGTVVFSTTTSANGNDSNTIDTCDIRDGATPPNNGIYSLGSTGIAAQNNSGNIISNCNIFNFYHTAAVDTAGARLDGGNTDWTILGNSFYQTVARAGQGANVRAIYVNSVSGNNFAVTGNFIGGSAANAGGLRGQRTVRRFHFLNFKASASMSVHRCRAAFRATPSAI